ncbi:MAG: hypothetical protein AAGJ81_10435 [Verrucomicrobiota bacterium]
MKRLFFSAIITLLAITSLQAQEALYVGKPEVVSGAPGKTVVEFKMENTLNTLIKGARAWIFLMGEDDKVVGNHAQWVVSQDKKNDLPSGETQTYKMTMPSQGKVTAAKVVFSRIILGDGSTVDPRKIVKSFPEKTDNN